ncbi:MAG: TIGR03862 family flavoprotein, partial [Planktotalea sp.]|uniref:TIGR03862 family flavoprotein n=1 Tax=Planktotalea sp. TaxID=2029877 RepID=UPI003C756EBE
MKRAIVIGGGPAGLMAADELSQAGAQVTIIEAKPSLGRKFLMAGKSGLNLTKDELLSEFETHYSDAQSWLSPILKEFGPTDVGAFAANLGQEVFTGSSGRVFPKAMKASPLLRAWILRLSDKGVEFRTKWRWTGWQQDCLGFQTPEGGQTLTADAFVFALGGASWARLGSDGQWAELFAKEDIELAPFNAANAAVHVDWSAHMQPHFGAPLKAVSFTSGPYNSNGEAVISERGLEGGGIYSVSRGVREGHALFVDLRTDWSVERVQ